MLDHPRFIVPLRQASSSQIPGATQDEHAPACSSEVVPLRSWMPQRSTTSMLPHCCSERPARGSAACLRSIQPTFLLSCFVHNQAAKCFERMHGHSLQIGASCQARVAD